VQWSGVSTHAGHMVGARLVVPVAAGREGSERSVVAVVGVAVVQRRIWIGTGATWEVRTKGPMGERRRLRTGSRCQGHSGGIGTGIAGRK